MTSLFYNINSIHDDITVMGNGFWQDSVYYVQIKDYQGNVWAVLDRNHNLVERNDYYPYGGLINASDTQLQPYKYSSKELDRENGLDLYDFSARMYDPMLPQTTSQDPLAEKYYSISPYTWCAGNPVRFVDITGSKIEFLENATSAYKNNYDIAYKYLKEHNASYILDELESRETVYYLSDCNDKPEFDSKNKVIYWNPYIALTTSNGYILTPAELLSHEFDHVLGYDDNPIESIERLNSRDLQYDNLDDRRVIEGSEQDVAKKLNRLQEGEKTREDHNGSAVEVSSPDSDDPVGGIIVTAPAKSINNKTPN